MKTRAAGVCICILAHIPHGPTNTAGWHAEGHMHYCIFDGFCYCLLCTTPCYGCILMQGLPFMNFIVCWLAGE
jgi:hypothetical protein